MQFNPKQLSGYIKEFFVYSSSLFRREGEPIDKFVIFSLPRSGSTLLVNLLDHHPNICCAGELLYYPLISPSSYILRRSLLAKKPVFGFKLLPTHFEVQRISDPAQFIVKLYLDGYKFIKLRRENLFRAALSSLYGEFIGKFHIKKRDKDSYYPKMIVNKQMLFNKLQRFQNLAEMHNVLTSKIPHFEIIYEYDLIDLQTQQYTMDRITEFLDQPKVSVYTDLVKTTTNELSGFLENAEETIEFLRGTDYEKLFNHIR